MGKVLVLYDSASGNTAKMAGLVAEGAAGISGIEVRLRQVEEATPDDPHCTYETLVCKACTRLHFINRATGKLLGETEPQAASPRPD